MVSLIDQTSNTVAFHVDKRTFSPIGDGNSKTNVVVPNLSNSIDKSGDCTSGITHMLTKTNNILNEPDIKAVTSMNYNISTSPDKIKGVTSKKTAVSKCTPTTTTVTRYYVLISTVTENKTLSTDHNIGKMLSI